MMKVGSAGRSGLPAATPAAGKPTQPKTGFDAAIAATRKDAASRPNGAEPGFSTDEGLSLEELKGWAAQAGLGKMRLEAGRAPEDAEGASLAERCRRALDALEAGEGGERQRETLRQAYGQLVCATEGAYGHLPHDDLTRILAMAEYAQKEGGIGT